MSRQNIFPKTRESRQNLCCATFGHLRGKLTIPYNTCPSTPDVPSPPGPGQDIPEDYTITPKAFEDQVLSTAGQTLEHDLLIKAIPYYETANNSEGLTVYIAEEV